MNYVLVVVERSLRRVVSSGNKYKSCCGTLSVTCKERDEKA